MMADIEDLNTSAALNNEQPPHGAPEGATYLSQVNDILRELMALLARWYADTKAITATGSAGAYAVTLTRSSAALTNGMVVAFIANHANTGAATLNVNGAGALPLVWPDNSALKAGAIADGAAVTAIYNASLAKWHLQTVPAPDLADVGAANTLLRSNGTAKVWGKLTVGDVPADTITSAIMAPIGTAGTYAYPTQIITDRSGRVSGITAGSAPVIPVLEWAIVTCAAPPVITAHSGASSAARNAFGDYTLTWAASAASANHPVVGNLIDTTNLADQLNLVAITANTVRYVRSQPQSGYREQGSVVLFRWRTV